MSIKLNYFILNCCMCISAISQKLNLVGTEKTRVHKKSKQKDWMLKMIIYLYVWIFSCKQSVSIANTHSVRWMGKCGTKNDLNNDAINLTPLFHFNPFEISLFPSTLAHSLTHSHSIIPSFFIADSLPTRCTRYEAMRMTVGEATVG